jgi:hypothetical protein
MATTTVDTTAGGQAVKILIPDGYTDKAVVYHHGVGETAASLTSDPLKAGVVNRLLSDGYLVASSSAAGDNWGNQAGLDAYEALQAYLVTNYAPAQTAIFSQSMGGCTGLLTAAAGGFVAWFGIYPVCSLSNMFGGNGGTYASSIRTAFGIAGDGSDYSTKTSGFDPLLLSASLYNRLPMRFWSSSGDTVVTKAGNSDLMALHVAGSKAESTNVACTGNHGDPSHFDPQGVSDFLDRAFVPRSNAYRSV